MDLKSLNQPKHKPHKMSNTQVIDYMTAKLGTINVQTEQKIQLPLTNKLKMTVDDLEIPPNATIRQEYVMCGDPDCQNQHGQYLYA